MRRLNDDRMDRLMFGIVGCLVGACVLMMLCIFVWITYRGLGFFWTVVIWSGLVFVAWRAYIYATEETEDDV